MTYKNQPWFVSGFTTAAGVIAEYNPAQTVYNHRNFRLRGFAVSGSTTLAISTTPMKLRYGRSSDATLTSVALTAEPGASMLGAAHIIGLEAGYFAIQSTVAHANGGLTVLLWGD